MNRLVIGVFRLAKNGGWEGEIRSLVMNLKVRLVPNDDRSSGAISDELSDGRPHTSEAVGAPRRAKADGPG